LPKDQILFAGDVLWLGFFPNVREANVLNQIQVVNRILELPVKYYIPGHGHITTSRDEVANMRDLLESLYTRIDTGVKEGKTLDEFKNLEEALVEKYPDWLGRKYLANAIEVIYQSLMKPQG
jgi:glyoxylase-like metal-dependent hydrolase (beta-lactamase superfamily II)